MRGADLLVRALAGAGVRHVFALSGNHVMPVFDAALDGGLDIVHVRHEAAAVHMADAWGRLTGAPGVALVTGGPGHANAVSALYPALANESPLLLLSGHAPLRELGCGAFQEMPQVGLAAPVSKASRLARSAESLGREVRASLGEAAAGRPGPVHLSLPTDVLEARVDASRAREVGYVEVEEVAEGDVGDGGGDARTAQARRARGALPQGGALDAVAAARIVEALDAASRPLVLTGPAMMRGRGRSLAIELQARTRVPVIGMDSPRGLADPALGAFAPILARADLVVLLAKPLDFTLRFGRAPAIAEGCRIVDLDPDPAMLERARRLVHASALLLAQPIADAETAAEALLRAADVRPHGGGDWLDEVLAALRHRPQEWAALRSGGRGAIHPVEVCAAVRRSIDAQPETVLVCDGGEFGQWARACIDAPERLSNGPSGSIGAGIPYAAAACLARPGSPVIAMIGDGSFGFHLAEIETAARRGLPFVAVVGNDARWNAEHQIQVREYGAARARGCELTPARYDLAVAALGGHGERVERAADLDGALARALASGRPACVNVAIEGVAAPSIA